ncbi:hypothetical protein AB1L88_05505 [Tautonia sp. JC769]|uniref:hypothetical protein n=1 Tax=Tautonia sp. JC769 TaxID=3232135 RepID=UPI0034586233
MAASLSQILANRLNALRSTGPKTEAGKASSSRNALKHGLSRVGTRTPADMAAAIADRKALWGPEYDLQGPLQQWAFDRLVAESVRLEFCEERICAARAELATTAAESWDDDRAAEAASLGARLSGRADRIQPLLLQGKHGVLWLLDRWAEVGQSLTRRDGWTPETWDLALDLLGVPPSARDGSGPWDLDPSDSGAAPGLDLVAQAVAALRERLDSSLDARDARHRLDAESGLLATDPAPLRLLERYAADARRQISRYHRELRHSQASSRRAPAGPIAPAESGAPGPRPDRTTSRSRPEVTTPHPPAEPDPEPRPAGRTSAPSSSRNEPATGGAPRESGKLQPTVSTPSAPLNRRARRARAALARRNA